MNILQINKFNHVVGGASRYFLEVSKILEEKGQNIASLCVKHKDNNYSVWRDYFIPDIAFDKPNFGDSLKKFYRMIYSFSAVQKIKELLINFDPQIVHCHTLYHYLSPSILPTLYKRNIPVVQSIADYHSIAPNHFLFHDGSICEITKPNKFYKAIFHKCVKNSYNAIMAEVAEKYIHYFLGWERNCIDYFIIPSQFMKNKLIEYGMDVKKLVLLPYFIDSRRYKPNYNPGDYILYFGRLSPEKGINYLIEVMKLLPRIKLIIVGWGNEEYEKKLKGQSSKLKNVEYIGFQDGIRLKKLIAASRFTVLPSVWYEVFGLTILESFACGKPVIASNIGGIPETVKDGFNGFLFEPGNVVDCVEKVNQLWNNPSLCKILGKNARVYIEKSFGPEEHYEKLMQIYKRAVALH